MRPFFYKHSLYHIQSFEETTGFTHIAIRRRDGKPIVAGWNTLQAIKNAIAATTVMRSKFFLKVRIW